MTPNDASLRRPPRRAAGWRLALALATLGTISGTGCSTTGGKTTPPIETRDASGFSISETARIPARAREAFAEATRALEAGDLDRAIALLSDLTQSAPELTAAQINLGLAFARKGELAEAETALLAALARNPRHPVAQNELGIAYRRMGRFQDARTRFEAALASHPDFHPAHRNLAILCDLYLADPACALAHYEHYHAAVPDDPKVGMWIADLRQRTVR
jgi:tetratricopeptide (TPR) repeat protein